MCWILRLGLALLTPGIFLGLVLVHTIFCFPGDSSFLPLLLKEGMKMSLGPAHNTSKLMGSISDCSTRYGECLQFSVSFSSQSPRLWGCLQKGPKEDRVTFPSWGAGPQKLAFSEELVHLWKVADAGRESSQGHQPCSGRSLFCHCLS